MGRGMTFREIIALMRRHLLAMTVVLMIVTGVAYGILSTPPIYSESATVVFMARNSPLGSRSNPSFLNPLVTTEVMMVDTLASPLAQSQIREAGGTASVDFVPFNLYSLQYPDYAEPIATLTTVSQRPADVQRTFKAVLRILGQRLAAMQARAGVPAHSRIQAFPVADTGPTVQPGSSTRVSAGLALLAVVAVFMVASFLERRQNRPGVFRPSGRRRLAARSAR
jgi:hypothetical protein